LDESSRRYHPRIAHGEVVIIRKLEAVMRSAIWPGDLTAVNSSTRLGSGISLVAHEIQAHRP
jgi:hypothetical protein